MGINVYQSPVEKNFWIELQRGNISGFSSVHKFGRNPAVGVTYAPVSIGAVYQTPQAAAATKLRVKAGDANDTAAGSGAREITVIGLDETGTEVTETLATAGASASSATTATFMRLYRAYVSASGTYATSTTSSHAANIVIENNAGGTDWLTIDVTSYSKAQSEVAAYSIPLGKTGYIKTIHISVDSKKVADVTMFFRENILEAAAPYSAMRIQSQMVGVVGEVTRHPETPFGPYAALTDIGFMAKAAAVAEIDINFEIILVNN